MDIINVGREFNIQQYDAEMNSEARCSLSGYSRHFIRLEMMIEYSIIRGGLGVEENFQVSKLHK